jgi:hypothetical protein
LYNQCNHRPMKGLIALQPSRDGCRAVAVTTPRTLHACGQG